MLMHGVLEPEAYKKAEKDFRFYKNLITKHSSVIVGFTIGLSGFLEINDLELRLVKGKVKRVYRCEELPFIEVGYLEYDEASRAMYGKTSHENIANTNKLADFAKAIMEHRQDVDMQTELGLIPTGLYSAVPVSVRLDYFNPHSIEINDER